jgi:hypothetical protein
MTTKQKHTNGHTPHVPLQFALDGRLVPVVTIDADPHGAALDELDTAIDTLATALSELTAARDLLAVAEAKVEVSRRRCNLLQLAVRHEQGRQA